MLRETRGHDGAALVAVAVDAREAQDLIRIQPELTDDLGDAATSLQALEDVRVKLTRSAPSAASLDLCPCDRGRDLGYHPSVVAVVALGVHFDGQRLDSSVDRDITRQRSFPATEGGSRNAEPTRGLGTGPTRGRLHALLGRGFGPPTGNHLASITERSRDGGAKAYPYAPSDQIWREDPSMANGDKMIETLEDKLERSQAALANSRKKLKEGGMILMESAEISAGAGVGGFIRGRYPEYADFGPSKAVPVEGILWGVGQMLAYNDPENAKDYRATANGAMAGYVHYSMMAWGQELAKKAKAKAPPALTATT